MDAQQNRAQLQGRLTSLTEDLDKLHLKSKSEGKRVGELLAERQNLAVKLRDRDEELRGKAKLLEVCFYSPSVCRGKLISDA